MIQIYDFGIIGLTSQFLLVSILVLQIHQRHESIDTNVNHLTQVYDYIVVGSGSSGAAVAHRLAEDGRNRVLLLEAGGPSGLATDIPSQASTSLHFNSQYDWNYTMDPQFVGRAFVGGVIPENRGFVVGGSSSINTMIYNRGNRRVYDTWAQEFGASGWSYEEVLPYFLKFEGNTDPHIVNQNPRYHSTSGPVQISSWATPDPLILIHQKTINKEIGIQNTDINGPVQVGTTLNQAFISRNGIRSSSSNAYIDPNPFPNNLHILTGSLVTKIIFEGNTAVGVTFERKGFAYNVFAHKEVIISAGVHNSAKLLMLSGIGPKEHLKQLHINVLKDLPVGENFHNHPSIDLHFLIKPEYLKLTNIPGSLTTQQLYQYLTQGNGPLSQYYRSITYFSTSNNNDKEWPNAGLEVGVYQFPQNLTDYRIYRFGERAYEWEQYLDPWFGRMYLYVHGLLQRVRSRGYVRLASIDPHFPPRINPFFLRNKQDYQDEIEIIRTILKIYELSSFSKYLEPMKPIPGCSFCPNKRYVYECESYIRCVIEQVIYTGYHGVGTCRMGAPERKDTVVDPKLKVKGISRLRVCDASIIPLLPNANTNAVAHMIGEKCAQLIKDQN